MRPLLILVVNSTEGTRLVLGILDQTQRPRFDRSRDRSDGIAIFVGEAAYGDI